MDSMLNAVFIHLKSPYLTNCRTWTRTKILASKGRCPTIRRSGKIFYFSYFTISLARRPGYGRLTRRYDRGRDDPAKYFQNTSLFRRRKQFDQRQLEWQLREHGRAELVVDAEQFAQEVRQTSRLLPFAQTLQKLNLLRAKRSR